MRSIYALYAFGSLTTFNFFIHLIDFTIIMHQHFIVGHIIRVVVFNLEVVGGFGCAEFLYSDFLYYCASSVGKEYILSHLQVLDSNKRFKVSNVERMTCRTNNVLFVDVYVIPLIRFVAEQTSYLFVGLFARMLVVGKDFVPDFDVLYRFQPAVRFYKSSFAEALAVGASVSCAPVALKTPLLNHSKIYFNLTLPSLLSSLSGSFLGKII